MNYLLLCFSCTLSIYFPVQSFGESLETENDQPIDDFVDKLLKSDKLDQLANIIAEKAVDKLVKIQSKNPAKTAKGEPIYRVQKNETNAVENKSSEQSNNISEEINTLSKNSPFSKLSLKYVKLIENKRGKNDKSKTKDKRTTRTSAKTNKTKIVESDRENEQKYAKDSETRVKKGKDKLRLGSSSPKLKRNRKTTTTKITTTAPTKITTTDDFSNEKFSLDGHSESKERTLNTTAILISGEDNKYYTHMFAKSEESTEEKKIYTKASIDGKNNVNLTNIRSKRILARENDRLYVFASSSDYDDLYIQDFNI